MNEIRTARPEHAIEVMAIGLDFETSADTELLTKLISIYDDDRELKKYLPEKQDVKALSINIKIDDSQDISTGDELVGVAGCDFYAKDEDGNLTWSISIRPNFISCNCRKYDRWAEVKSTVLNLLMPYINFLQKECVGISSIGMQYLDVFHVDNVSFPSFNRTMFSEKSQYLARSVFDNERAWHTHHGWGELENSQKKFLNNFNLDILELSESEGSFQVRLNGNHKFFVPDSLDIPFESAIDSLHNKNKKVLCDILNPDVLTLIKLSCG